MRANVRGHLSLLVVVASAAAVLVIAPGAAAGTAACVGTVLGGTHGNVVVESGQSCVLNAATVNGNITALAGSRLLVINSTVGGNVVGNSGAIAVQVYNSTVHGNVDIKQAGPAPISPGFVTCSAGTGSAFTTCEALVYLSTVEGNVNLVKTIGTAWVRGVVGGDVKVVETDSTPITEFADVDLSDVAHNVTVSKNTGPGLVFVQDNTVGGNLVCLENDLPLISSGNFAKSVTGQCTAAPLALSLLLSPESPVAVQQG